MALDNPTNGAALSRAIERGAPREEDLERAGKAILILIERAAGATATRVAMAADTAQKLAVELRTAEDRIGELELEVRHYQERAVRAEEWLLRVQHEIQNNFFKQNALAQTPDDDR